jgi:hypothetical protein
VTWSDFQWESGNVGDPEPIDTLNEPIRFARTQYEAELMGANHQLAELPEDEPLFGKRPRRGRRLRWPWRPRPE